MTGIDDVTLNFSPGSMWILNAVLAIVMFSIALDLAPSDFHRLRKAPKALLVGFFSQFIVLPVLTFLMVLAIEPRPSIALGLMLVAACPGGNISNFITHRAGGNAALSVSMTGIATVAAILITPFNIAFWGSLYPPTHAILQQTSIDPVQIAITVGLMLVLPLILGVQCNHRYPSVAAKIRRPLQWVAMIIFIAFVILALAANWSYFLAYAGAVAGLVILHNSLALIGGWITATAFRLSPFDRRAITIETGIQNSALGLVLIFAFFNGLGGMAVVAAFWGIWHAISGLGLAFLFARTEAPR
ncbi:bile acid:sodium symporter family protein [Sneathiella limimaris]|uniref:bile acid:sodium symporter family protein n=1 Tax=Sneathiella limimaris TaxID=1964213 RepID=UPI00146D8E59|nr:bile acid:sodium symporter family protein [Sneathiella limimaris]